jgi:hypothetical protein
MFSLKVDDPVRLYTEPGVGPQDETISRLYQSQTYMIMLSNASNPLTFWEIGEKNQSYIP